MDLAVGVGLPPSVTARGGGRATADDARKRGDGGHPLIDVVGELLGLGPLDRELLPTMVHWANDFALGELAGFGARPIKKDAVEAIFEHAFRGDRD